MYLIFIRKNGIGSCSRRKLDKEEANSLRRMVHLWNSFRQECVLCILLLPSRSTLQPALCSEMWSQFPNPVDFGWFQARGGDLGVFIFPGLSAYPWVPVAEFLFWGPQLLLGGLPYWSLSGVLLLLGCVAGVFPLLLVPGHFPMFPWTPLTLVSAIFLSGILTDAECKRKLSRTNERIVLGTGGLRS